MEAIHSCVDAHPELTIIVEKSPPSAIDFNAYDLTVWFGEKPEEVKFATPLTHDELVLIVNPANPIQELTLGEARSIFAGQVQEWSEISNFERPVSVWTYPDENLLQSMIISEVMEDDHFSSLAHLASSPQAMLEAITRDRSSIGFLPRSWLNDEVSQIQINQDTQGALRKPILALTKNKPQGSIHTLLACMQTGVGQETILRQHSPNN
jgi:ABC-type phosphate transport system substrate-binding protein